MPGQILGTSGFISDDETDYNVSEWGYDATNDKQEVSDVSSNWKQFIAGLNGATLNFKIFWGATAGSFTTIFAIGSEFSVTAFVGNTGKSVSGTVIVDHHTLTNSAKTPVEFGFAGTFTGEPSVPS